MEEPLNINANGTVLCPDCHTRVRVGTAGVANFNKCHRSMKACADNLKAYKKQQSIIKNRENAVKFFAPHPPHVPPTVSAPVLIQSNPICLQPTMPFASASASITQNDMAPILAKGCPDALKLLLTFQSKISNLLDNVAKADSSHPLAQWAFDPTGCVGEDEDTWEKYNGPLNTLLQKSPDELQDLACIGELGLMGLCQFLHYLVEHHGIPGALIEGKVEQLMAAIDRVSLETAVTHPKPSQDIQLPSVNLGINAEPPINVDALLDEPSAKMMLLAPSCTCPGLSVTIPQGKSIHTAYLFGLHEELGDPWDYTVEKGQLTVCAHSCDKDNLSDGLEKCLGCDELKENPNLQGILRWIEEGVHENARLIFHGVGGLIMSNCKKQGLIKSLCLKGLNDAWKVARKAVVLESYKQWLLAVGLLAPLPLLNLEVGDDDLTCDKDYKHIFKCLRNLSLHVNGIVVHGVHITPSVICSHLMSNEINSTHANYLLNPNDKQDVKLAYDPLREIWLLPSPPADQSPGFHHTLGTFFHYVLTPYICVKLSLSEQLEHLSAVAHLLMALLAEGNMLTCLMPTQLYVDIIIMIKNVYFCVTKAKVDDPHGNDANADATQLGGRITGTTEVAMILAKHPEWDRPPWRLKFPALDKSGLEVHRHVDHVGPATWLGDTMLSHVNLQTSWRIGCSLIEKKFPTLIPVLDSMASQDMFLPLGKDLVKGPRHPDDIDDTVDDHDPLESSNVVLGVELEDATAETETNQKFDPCFSLNGMKVFKSRHLNGIKKQALPII
ncbi:hypothetical protein DXG01_002900 [Tephrocybe rancida]|nr:hypothetical protein DXG01_002900 [Tephrocybe rancida]